MAAGAFAQPIFATAPKAELKEAKRPSPEVTTTQLAGMYDRLKRAYPKAHFLVFGGAAVKMLCGDRPISDFDVATDMLNAGPYGVTVSGNELDFQSPVAREAFIRRAHALGFKAPPYFQDESTSMHISLQPCQGLFQIHPAPGHTFLAPGQESAPVLDWYYEKDIQGPTWPVRIRFVHPALQIINKGLLVDQHARGNDKFERDLEDLCALLNTFYGGDVERFISEEGQRIAWAVGLPKGPDEKGVDPIENAKAMLRDRVARGQELLKRAAEGAVRG